VTRFDVRLGTNLAAARTYLASLKRKPERPTERHND
jgi:hypothetical protein